MPFIRARINIKNNFFHGGLSRIYRACKDFLKIILSPKNTLYIPDTNSQENVIMIFYSESFGRVDALL
jgi:hypothetical protein